MFCREGIVQTLRAILQELSKWRIRHDDRRNTWSLEEKL